MLQKKNIDNAQLLGTAHESDKLHILCLVYIILNEMLQLSVAVYYFCNITGLKLTVVFDAANYYLAYCRYVQWFSSSVFLLMTRYFSGSCG